MAKSLKSIALLCLFYFNSGHAITLDTNQQCGLNTKCLTVDTVAVKVINTDTVDNSDNIPYEISEFVGTLTSDENVYLAWEELTQNRGCYDVSDVVVGGTATASGVINDYFASQFEFTDKERKEYDSFPGGFAGHLVYDSGKFNLRCTIVVNYSMPLTYEHHDHSTEVGRRALAVVLNTLDKIRASSGIKGKMRVWGTSKGAAVVESLWTIEAQNNTKIIVSDIYDAIKLDPCPSKNCYYFGFGYPWSLEQESMYPVSRDTSALWIESDRGYMMKPNNSNNHWWRLATFTNKSDVAYTCSAPWSDLLVRFMRFFDPAFEITCLDLLGFDYIGYITERGETYGGDKCHVYKPYLAVAGYSEIDTNWNQPESYWLNNSSTTGESVDHCASQYDF